MNHIVWQPQHITKIDRAGLNHQKPFVIWLTGLSGSGKSTVASLLDAYLFQQGFHSYLLDGDNIRHGLNKDLGFDYDSRVENIRRIGEVAKLMVDAGLIVITAFISPYVSDRAMVRAMFGETEFIEVFVNASLATCEARDSKGLYKKARLGLIKDFTGIDSPYEPPLTPELTLHSDTQTIADELSQVLAYLNAHKLITPKLN